MTKPKYHSETVMTLRNCLNKTIANISRVQYYFNDNEDTDGLGNLEFMFTDNSYLTLTGLGDAASIKAINNKAHIPETFNVTDKDNCSWKKLDLNKEFKWNKIIGQRLNNIEIIWDSDKFLIGCILHFDFDFLIFNETGSDTNIFKINERPAWVDNNTVIEVQEKNEC